MQLFGYELVPVAAHQQLQEDRTRLIGKAAGEELARHQAEARAQAAEAAVRLQAKTIERLMTSNDRMVGLVSDMRRVGFGILEPTPETSDTPRTIDQEDRAAVEADEDLAADDDQ